MGRRGPKRRLELESEYWRLLSAGIVTVDACREVGIGRKTGFRWRQENGGLPPARLGPEHGASRYLSRLERQRIASLAERGHGVREIARRLDRAPSTVSRELLRNRSPHDRGGYEGDLAHARARERARRPKPSRLALDVDLRAVVAGKLELEWSPEQIAVHLRHRYPERRDWHLCPETIYQALYLPARGGLSRTLTKKLRTGRPMRRRRRRPDRRLVRFAVPGATIAMRPPSTCSHASPLGTGRVISFSAERTVQRSERSSNATAGSSASSTSPPDTTPTPCMQRSPSCSKRCPRSSGAPSPGIKGERWRGTWISHGCSATASSSPTRPAPGSGGRTRTRTACSGSTFRRAPTSRPTALVICRPWKRDSTNVRAKYSAGRPRPMCSLVTYSANDRSL